METEYGSVEDTPWYLQIFGAPSYRRRVTLTWFGRDKITQISYWAYERISGIEN